MSSSCKIAMQYHGRGNSQYRDCRKHIECEQCHKEITQNMELIYEHSDEDNIYKQYGVDYNLTKNPTKYAECESYCENFNQLDKKTCMRTCLQDGNAIGFSIEAIGRKEEEEWQTYTRQVQHATRRILFNMKHASPRTRKTIRQKIEQLASNEHVHY
jgi:hypothetical protein